MDRCSTRFPWLWLIAFLLVSSSVEGTPSLLRAQGTKLVDEQGHAVQLKGVNLGGWLLQETWMTPVKGSLDHFTTRKILTSRFGEARMEELFRVYEDHWITGEDLDEIKSLGFSVVRVPFGYWNLQTDQGNWRRNVQGEIDFGRLDWIVNECGARGLYVILDLHGAPGFASNEHSSGRVGASKLFAQDAEGQGFRSRTIGLWTEIARHFRDSGTVAAYDLLNEPMARPSDLVLWEFYDQLYRAIRGVDPLHLISMEAIWEVGNLPHPREFSWTNVLYQTHDYGWDQNQGDFIAAKIRASSLARVYDVPLLVGEFNAFGQLGDWERTLARYDVAGFQWTTWTYKVSKKGSSSWAIYSSPFVPSPDVLEDSDDEIAMVWSKTGTFDGDFSRNDLLLESLSQSLRRPAYPASE